MPVAAAVDLFDRFMSLHDELVSGCIRRAGRFAGGALGTRPKFERGRRALRAGACERWRKTSTDAPRRAAVASSLGRAVLEAIEGRTSDLDREVRGERDGLLQRVRSIRRRGATLTGAAMAAGAMVAGADEAVVRSFERAGRLLAAALTAGDRELCRRIAAKAAAAVRPFGAPAPASIHAFNEVVDYVVARRLIGRHRHEKRSTSGSISTGTWAPKA